MRVSFIIPTLHRTAYLHRCLDAIAEMTTPPAEVVVAMRASDSETREFLSSLGQFPFPVGHTECERTGVIASMQAALETTQSEIVALMDDDATPKPDWLDRVLGHFQADPKVAGVGGKDLIQDDPVMRARQPVRKKVGVFTWYGRGHGNHHRGCGGPREVHVLKGCNCAYDGRLLRSIGFDHRLRGEGAQVGCGS